MTGFWDYAAVAQKLRPDSFGDYVRLVVKRVRARPREVSSLAELRAALAEARVDVSTETIRRVWSSFAKYRDQTKEGPR